MKKNEICFGTAFYHAEGSAPNIKTENNKFYKYYNCMVVLFSSIRKFYDKEDCVIFTDKQLPSKYKLILEKLKVRIMILNRKDIIFVNKFNNKFPGCLFTLDVLSFFEKNRSLSQHKTLCLLDGDVIMNKKITQLSSLISEEKKISGIILDYNIDKKTNGFSRTMLNTIYNEFYSTSKLNSEFKYFGGEFYYIDHEHINVINKEIKILCNFLENNNTKFGLNFTEEHLLSIVLNNYLDKTIKLNNIIKRLWTTNTYHNITGNELDYCFLHMPSEKEMFFQNTFKLLESNINFINDLNSIDYSKLIKSPINNRLNPPINRQIKIILIKILKFLRIK